MIEGKGRGDLPVPGHSRSDVMTFITIEFLRRAMLRVTESDFECCRLRGYSRITAEFMAGAAGRNVAAVCLGLWSMALVASGVGVEARRDRKGLAATQRPVTSRTIHFESAGMDRVIKLHVETLERWKSFERA